MVTGPNSDRDVKIGPTAHYTAYVWHRLGLPHAELFATPRGARLFWSLRLSGEWMLANSAVVPSMSEYLEFRHRSIEYGLDQIAPDRIVELGAGLSRRGLTWSADRGVEYIEVDLPHMVAAKRALIERRASSELRARCATRLRHESHDVLSDDFGRWLGEALHGARRPVVVAEGLLGYFSFAERERLARSVHAGLRAAGGGHFLCELRQQQSGGALGVAVATLRGMIKLVTRGRGVGPDYETVEAARSLFLRAGFAAAEPFGYEAVPHLAHKPVPVRVWRARA